MHWSVHALYPDSKRLSSLAKKLDELGYYALWIAENHVARGDLYVQMAASALNTEKLKIGSGVTNLITRDITVIASSIYGIDALSGGRAILGLGSGDVCIRRLGLKPSTLKEMETGIQNIRTLLNGGEIRYGNSHAHVDYKAPNLPIYLAAEGPKTLRLAGSIADGIIMGSGLTDDIIEWSTKLIDEGVKTRNSSLREPEIFFGAMCTAVDDRATARTLVRHRLANRSRHVLMASKDTIPPNKRQEASDLINRFDFLHVDSEQNSELVTDYMIDRFSVCGTIKDCIEKLRSMRDAGVKNLVLDFPRDILEAQVEVFANKIIPNVS